MNTELKNLKDVKDTLKEIVDFLGLKENEEVEAVRVPSYKERTINIFIKQLKEIYTSVIVTQTGYCNQSDFEKWLCKYQKTALWNLLRVLPSVIEAELEIENAQLSLNFWKNPIGNFRLNINIISQIIPKHKEEIRQEIVSIIQRQKLPDDCYIDILMY